MQQTFSKKDGNLIQQSFKKLIEQFYQNPTPQLPQTLILLNTLTTQSITYKSELDTQQIIPKLEQLKIKVKANQVLKDSILKTIQHLQFPQPIPLSPTLLLSCIEQPQIFQVTCMIAHRLLQKNRIKGIDKKMADTLIQAIAKGCERKEGVQDDKQSREAEGRRVGVGVDAIVGVVYVCGGGGGSGVVGLAQMLLERELYQNQKEKPIIQKCLKIILIGTQSNNSLIQGHQIFLSNFLQLHPSIILQLQDVINNSYTHQYCQHILDQLISQYDPTTMMAKLHIWSYSSTFCNKITEPHILPLLKFSPSPNCSLPYTILHNILSTNPLPIPIPIPVPISPSQATLKSYLQLMILLKSQLSHKELPTSDFLEKLAKENSVNTESVKRLLAVYRDRDREKERDGFVWGKKGSEGEDEAVLGRAMRVPRCDEDLRALGQILRYRAKSDDYTQQDMLQSLKSRALKSLQLSILNCSPIPIQILLNTMTLLDYDTPTTKKLLTLCNLQLKHNPKFITVLDIDHVLDIVLELEEIPDRVDFGEVEELLGVVGCGLMREGVGEEEWRKGVIGAIRDYKIKGGFKNRNSIKVNQHVQQEYDKQEDYQHQQNPTDHQTTQVPKKQETGSIEQKPQVQPQKQVKQQLVPEVPGIQKIGQDQQIVEQKLKHTEPQIDVDYNSLQIEGKKQESTSMHKQQQTNQSTIANQNQNQKQPEQHKQQQQIPEQQPEQQQPKKQQPKEEQSEQQTQSKEQPEKQRQSKEQPCPSPLIPNIILKHRIKQMLKTWKKRATKSRKRKFILTEWYQTQSKYLQKLYILKKQLLAPLIARDIINVHAGEQILPNIDAMIRLSQEMKQATAELLSHYHPIRTELAPTLKPMINFLKIYKDYSQTYESSKKTLIELSTLPNFPSSLQSNMPTILGDYLFSPVQRFLKYRLLVREYLQQLPATHIDTYLLRQQLQQLGRVNQQINLFMEQQNRMKVMLEIQNKFGNVVTNARFFLGEIPAFCGGDGKLRVYVFNDLLIAAKLEPKEQLHTRMRLSNKSTIHIPPDCASFTNRICILGSDTLLHLTFPTKQSHTKAHKFLMNILETLYQKEQQRMDLIYQSQTRGRTRLSEGVGQGGGQISNGEVGVQFDRLGLSAEVVAIERVGFVGGERLFFVVKFWVAKPVEMYQMGFCELAVLDDLEKFLKNMYPKLKIPSIEIKTKQSISDNITKASQHLCMAAQKFLNFIIRNKTLSQKPQRTLLKLGLHQQIWQLLTCKTKLSECSCQTCLITPTLPLPSYNKQLQNKNSYNPKPKLPTTTTTTPPSCIINSWIQQASLRNAIPKPLFEDLLVDERILWANCMGNRVDFRQKSHRQTGRFLSFAVSVYCLSQLICIEVKNATIYSNAREVITEVCGRLGVQTSLDLALVFCRDERELIMDSDQLILPFAKCLIQTQQQCSKKQQTRFSIFDRLSKGLQDDKKIKKVSICLRKIICLKLSVEQKTCQLNHQRYNLVVGEILRKFKHQTIAISNAEAENLCALVYCIQQFSQLQANRKISVTDDKLKKYLPETKKSLLTSEFRSRITQKILQILTPAPTILHLYKQTLNSLWHKQMFQYFPITIHSIDPVRSCCSTCSPSSPPTSPTSTSILSSYKSLQLGVCYKKISICKKGTSSSSSSSSSGGVLLQYSLSMIDYRCYGDSLYFWVEGDQFVYCFKGANLVVFDWVVRVYKTLHQFEYSN